MRRRLAPVFVSTALPATTKTFAPPEFLSTNLMSITPARLRRSVDSSSISTAYLERYLSVARQVTRLATGLPPTSPKMDRFEIPLHVLQDERQSEDLPFGSRGGIAVRYEFPIDGEYLIKVRLQRQYQDYIKGMGWHQQQIGRASCRERV